MPYIKEDSRLVLDECIEHLVACLRLGAIRASDKMRVEEKLSNNDLLNISGDINYCFSRILAGIMGDVSYPKIAIITGVLENIKQEFYRRVAEPYENRKIVENGDITEYKKLK